MRAGQPIATFSGSSSSEKMDWFGRLAMQTAILTGRPLTFLGAAAGRRLGHHGADFPLQRHLAARYQYRDDHCYLLVVFLIQATQNRDTLALQIKLSELILALEGARNELAAVERQPEGALENIAEEIRERAGVPDIPGKT